MDIETVKAFTKSGSAVGLISLVLYLIVDRVFSEPVYTFLGDEKTFIIILSVLAVLVTAILASVLAKKPAIVPPSGPQVIYRDRSKHNGDNRF
tara:strand:+ start:821 stop:1099 length:279 start_codon:yes stop_codon:yes gene_type:complete